MGKTSWTYLNSNKKCWYLKPINNTHINRSFNPVGLGPERFLSLFCTPVNSGAASMSGMSVCKSWLTLLSFSRKFSFSHRKPMMTY